MFLPRLTSASRQSAIFAFWLLALAVVAPAREFNVEILSDTNGNARSPSVGETGWVAWQEFKANVSQASLSPRPDIEKSSRAAQRSDLVLWREGQATNLTEGMGMIVNSERPQVFRDSVLFTAYYKDNVGGGYHLELSVPEKNDSMSKMQSEYPGLFDPPQAVLKSGLEFSLGPTETNEVENTNMPVSYQPMLPTAQQGKPQFQTWRHSGKAGDIAVYRADGGIERITPGGSHISMPAISEAGIAFQHARGWPYGYEMMAWKTGGTNIMQLTTNYFYVLNANIHGNELVFQAWDGDDYEIMLYRFDTGMIEQITNNQFDDVSPVVWDGQIVWMAYPTVTAEIFLWRDGGIRKISEGTEDNGDPSFWQGRAVWQAYDDTDLEIYYFDGRRTIKLTSNTWDDMAPQINDGVVTWISYVDNWDAEIMALDLSDNTPVQLTDNEWEDSLPRTAGERVVWHTLGPTGSFIQMATPKAERSAPIR